MIETEFNVKKFISLSMELSSQILNILIKYSEKDFLYFTTRCPFSAVNIEGVTNKHTEDFSKVVISIKHRVFRCKDCDVIFYFNDLIALTNSFIGESKKYLVYMSKSDAHTLYGIFDEANEKNSRNVKLNLKDAYKET